MNDKILTNRCMFNFQALLLRRLSEDEVGVASLFKVFEPSGLQTLPPVRGPGQEGQGLQRVHEERGVMREARYFALLQLLYLQQSNNFDENQDARTIYILF